MKFLPSLLVAVIMTFVIPGATIQAQSTPDVDRQRAVASTKKRVVRKKSGSASRQPVRRADTNLSKALKLANSGRYQEASKILFQLSRSPKYQREAPQIKYILGLMMFEMKLNQAAAFVFYDVIRSESRKGTSSKYLKQSLEKLSIAADYLDSDVLLKYAIKKINEDEFPSAHRDMLYYRKGELNLSEGKLDEAARFFGRVKGSSAFYAKAKYKQGLALAEAKQTNQALSAFSELAEVSKEGGVTDINRVSGLLGRARVLYQMRKWDQAIEAYREVPRDTEAWHEALFESTWAHLRSARFRSALSNFHSLHSPYYEDFYQPESLLLRAIVYLYICKYEEMGKVLDLYDKLYTPVRKTIFAMLKGNRTPESFYSELAKVAENMDSLKSDIGSRKQYQIPFIVSRRILKEGDVKKSLNYLKKLEAEMSRMGSMPASWKNSGIGKYSRHIIEKRIESTKRFAGKQIRRHLIRINNELRDLFEQSGFLRFEMVSGRKEALKKEIAGKGILKTQIDGGAERDYFIQNGYEYWPFTGEYWLDEIGNYHYVGVQACE